MSGYALIYDLAGADWHCKTATYNMVKDLIDDKACRIEYLSQAPKPLNDPGSDPVKLIVIPGGNYYEMEKEVKRLSQAINELVFTHGASYLGICAGAIAAPCSPLLFYYKDLVPHVSNPVQDMVFSYDFKDKMHLRLYSGNCSLFTSPGFANYGTQKVRRVTSQTPNESFNIYFQRGVFFPDAEARFGLRPLLEYPSYKFNGDLTEGLAYSMSYRDIVPVAAVTKKAGNGRIVLSGVHPEITQAVVRTFNAIPETQKAKDNAIAALEGQEANQIQTMRDFLTELSIETKKV